MEQILLYLEDFYYTNAILIISTIILVYISIKKRNNIKHCKFLFLYPLVSLIQQAIIFYSIFRNSPDYIKRSELNNLSINLFIIIELLIVFFLFIKILRNKLNKLILLILQVGYVLYYIYYFTIGDMRNPVDPSISIAQCFVIIIPCLFYFIELFNRPATLNLINEPNFWLASGLLINFSFMLPGYILIDKIVYDKFYYVQSTFSLIYISYSILFLLFTKAYTCNSIITQ